MQFPDKLRRILVINELDSAGLVQRMNTKGYRITEQFMGMVLQGKRPIPVKQLDRICDILKLSDTESQTLHRAAAMDKGYRIW